MFNLNIKHICLFILLTVSTTTLHAMPQQALVPGGIALLQLPNHKQDSKIYFNNKRIAVFPYKNTWVAMAGISLSTKPGDYEFLIKHADGSMVNSKVTIAYKKYAEQHITIKNKRKVNPNKEDMKRITAESIRKKQAKKQFTDSTANVAFVWPLSGRISGTFGLRRFFNGQERRPHGGLDIAAKEGTAILAAANGTVIDSGYFFFSGNMLYLDHGQGIISLYAHMSEILVKPGDTVKQGDIIGKVGQTGRSTGPHLHFSILANQTLIDPILMLPVDGNQYSEK